MNGRSTAEIVADLRDFVSCLSPSRPTDHIREAADRLTELDAKVSALAANITSINDARPAKARLDFILALRPPCPTCGGTGTTTTNEWAGSTPKPCPDCVDGKVSIERLAATWRRVWMFPVEERTEATWAYEEGWRGCIDHLRAVRP